VLIGADKTIRYSASGELAPAVLSKAIDGVLSSHS
jgi:hypothetical protein